MPLPSQDNIYRFQNIDPQSERKKREKKNDKREKREKKEGSSSFPKVIVSAAVFGVVAALCFFACNAILRAVSGQGGSNSVVSQSSQIPLTTVSAGAITGVTDVSGIVDGVMPSIVAITEKSTQQSYFGQTYSSQGAGSGFIVKQSAHTANPDII